jgi:hypothetical protein
VLAVYGSSVLLVLLEQTVLRGTVLLVLLEQAVLRGIVLLVFRFMKQRASSNYVGGCIFGARGRVRGYEEDKCCDCDVSSCDVIILKVSEC